MVVTFEKALPLEPLVRIPSTFGNPLSSPIFQPSGETPPPYSPPLPMRTPSTSQLPIVESSVNAPRGPPAFPKSNFLTIKRTNSSLKGTYVIDPDMSVPEAMLAALKPGEGRKNLELRSENGSIKAEVWLVACERPSTGKNTRAMIDVHGENGSVTVKMNADGSRPFSMNISAQNGSITLAIPTSFTGSLTTYTANGSVNISSSLAPHVTTFSDIKNTRKCFVGDFASSNYGQGEWDGSSLNIESHNGRVKLRYVDEDDDTEGRSESGFWGKLFGMS